MRYLGAKDVELVRYATSGDVTGDREEVVGYAGLVVR
jgi:AmmeMemoRadiSam system protein B